MNKNDSTLYILCTSELCERFAYFGLFTILVLKLHTVFQLTDSQSFTVFGLFAALSYSMLVIGGWIADRWLGQYRAILFGGVLLVIGNLFLASNHLDTFYVGLAVVIVGTSFYKVNCTTLVGVIFQGNTDRRERAFTLLYTAMNIGGLLGPMSYGFLIHYLGWASCFYLNAILLAMMTVILLFNKALKPFSLHSVKNWFAVGVAFILILSLAFGFIFIYIANLMVIALWGLIVAAFAVFIVQQNKTTQKKLSIILILNLGCLFFFAASLQVASSITLFIQRDVYRVFDGFTLPTPLFSALDPLFVVLMAPVFLGLWTYLKRRNMEPVITSKIALGILLAAAAFFVLHLTAQHIHNHSLAITGIVLANFLLGSGEICITPSVLSAINHYAPKDLQSTMMGVWFLFIALAGFIAGKLSTLASTTAHAQNSTIYAGSFIHITYLGFVAAMVIYCGKFLINKLSANHF